MDKIIDLHTHILPGIDDGCHNVKEAIDTIKYLKEHNIRDIVLTSHYIENTEYSYNQISRVKILEKLKEELNDDEVNLYLGNEVFLSENVLKLLEEHEISTINNTRYMLIELPLNGHINNIQSILCDLTNYGIIPIIAHPERYQHIQRNHDQILELLEFGCLLQCNIDSINGKYGKKAKKLMKWLLKNNLVQFVSTDTHYVGNKEELDKAYKKLKKIVGLDKYMELTYKNASLVLENQEILGNLDYLIKREKR